MHMLLENQLAALVTLISDRMETAYSELSPRAVSALLTLYHRGPLDLSTLATIIGTTQPTATRLIDGLEKAKLVERGAKQGRSISLALTRAGKSRAEQITGARAELTSQFLEPLDNEERDVLAELIDKLAFEGTQDRRHARTTCRYCDHALCTSEVCPIGRKASVVEAQDS